MEELTVFLGVRWVITAAVIGGLIQTVKVSTRTVSKDFSESRLFKGVIVPYLPLLLGVFSGLAPIFEGDLTWRIVIGLLAGLSAGFTYDRVNKFLKRRKKGVGIDPDSKSEKPEEEAEETPEM